MSILRDGTGHNQNIAHVKSVHGGRSHNLNQQQLIYHLVPCRPGLQFTLLCWNESDQKGIPPPPLSPPFATSLSLFVYFETRFSREER